MGVGMNDYLAASEPLIFTSLFRPASSIFNAAIDLIITDKKDEADNATGTKVVLSFPSNLETA